MWLAVVACLAAVAASSSVPVDGMAPADPRATVVRGSFRATMLTSRLFRFEYSTSGSFDDRATFAVVNRRLPVPAFVVADGEGVVNITLSGDGLPVVISYRGGSGLDGLSVEIDGGSLTWTPSLPFVPLNGTYQALDYEGDSVSESLAQYWAAMQPGLVSRAGWSALDDTYTTRFGAGNNNWTWWQAPGIVQRDVYLLLYPEMDLAGALAEWTLVSGSPALPPRRAFGIWWSLYHRYSANDFASEVLQGYADNELPLDTVVLDMDWHKEPLSLDCKSWGNYDWDLSLFPDPAAFVSSLHSGNNPLNRSLFLSLNLHPDTGVDNCNDRYPAIAKAMGVPWPKVVACNFDNQTFAESVFGVYLNALPLRAVNLWWTDYGGCGGQVSNQMFWSNYVFGSNPHSFSNQTTRSIVLARYGGPGSQRQPIGFSGDTFQHEEVLAFLIQTTPLAANVLFGFWSHDVGGFRTSRSVPGDGNPANETGSELYLRWIQFGVVSPIFRTHCDHCERRIWKFQLHFPLMKQAFELRAALVSYLYSAAIAFSASVASAPVRPIYHEAPLQEEAYTFLHQYLFGPAILAAPVFEIGSASVSKTVFLPEGTWADWEGDSLYSGPVNVTRQYTLAQIPLFVRTGSVVPLSVGAVAEEATPDLTWVLWLDPAAPAAQGAVLEDDGISSKQSGVARTAIACSSDASAVSCKVAPTEGGFPGQRTSRRHALQLRGLAGRSVTAAVPGLTVVSCPTPGTLVCPTGAVTVSMDKPVDLDQVALLAVTLRINENER
jgi:alpha-glucosidase (family GH31 glycosyl hydrolase)